MKLRLNSHSVRFRITAEEMDKLATEGVISCTTTIPTSAGEVTLFGYEIQRATDRSASDLEVKTDGFTLWLNDADFNELAAPENEGVYLRRHWIDSQGCDQRCVIYVERDKPKKHKINKHKREQDKHGDMQSGLYGADVASTSDHHKAAE